MHNLISKNSEAFIDQRHIKDSLRIINSLPKDLDIICDFGSGAGFPAIPLAIYLSSRGQNTKIFMYESRGKKCKFLQTCIEDLKLENCEVINERIEKAAKQSADLITARAFASLKKIFDCSQGYVSSETKFLLHKGVKIEEEIEEAQGRYNFDYELLDKNEDGGVILLASSLKAK